MIDWCLTHSEQFCSYIQDDISTYAFLLFHRFQRHSDLRYKYLIPFRTQNTTDVILFELKIASLISSLLLIVPLFLYKEHNFAK